MNIRDQEGDLLRYPYNLGAPRIWARANDKWEGHHWTIKVQINQRDSENPFALILANEVLGKPSDTIQEHIRKENFIRKIYEETGATERDAKNTVNALLRITGDLYTERERFIFELLQNADDAPNEEKGYVDTEIHLLSEHLLFLHNGRPFSDSDVESIASIGDSTKKKDSATTGYKGIGFKALFTEVDSVIIRSGSFSFAFDKHSPLYKNEDMTATPWQLKPIWQERYRYPREVRTNEVFMSYPVSLALSLIEPGLSQQRLEDRLSDYKSSIKNLFSEPRFLLFLRHIKSVKLKGLGGGDIIVSKLFDGDTRETLRLEVDECLHSLWKVHSVEFDISEAIREAMRGSKETPEKMKEMLRSKLSFAAMVGSDGTLQAVTPSESVLFTYLPTSVSRYYLPFLVNADFLTTASREDIHRKNPWNTYLFEQIGYNVFHWITRLAQGEHRNEIVSIIPQRYEEIEAVTEAFNRGVDEALEEIAFLPTASGDLSKVSECFIDQTGWGEIMGDWIFALLSRYADKKCLSPQLRDGEQLIARIGVSPFEAKDLYEAFKKHDFYRQLSPKALLEVFEKSSIGVQDFVERVDLALLNEWLCVQTDATRGQFTALLESSGLRQDTRKHLNHLRLWRFGEVVCDANSAYRDSNKIWLRPQVAKIVDILKKLGIVVSSEDYGIKYPNIYGYLSKRSDKVLFEQLKACVKDLQTLTFAQRKTLLVALTDEDAKWEGVGASSVANLSIFRNKEGRYSPLNELISPKVSSSAWLSEHVLHEEEYFCEQEDLLIPEKEVYSRVILPNWETLAEEFNEMAERASEHLYVDIAHFYKFSPDAKLLSSLGLALYPNSQHRLLARGDLFYHKEIAELSASLYHDLDLALRTFGLYLPHRGILSYLSDEGGPFVLSATDASELKLQEEHDLPLKPLEALVDFFVGRLRWRFFEKWGVAICGKETCRLFERSSNQYQYWSKDKSVQRFINELLSDELYLLPPCLVKYKEESGILLGKDLHLEILERVSVEGNRESLIDIVAYSAKKKFLEEMGTIQISISSDTNDFAYKVIKLAIEEEYSLREQIEIDNDGVILKLSDLPRTLEDSFRIDDKCFSLSILIPDADQESNIAIALLNKFIENGLDKEKLLKVFGFEEGENTDEAIQRVVDSCMLEGKGCPIAANREQLLFFVYLEEHGKLPLGFACYDMTQEPNQGLFYTKSLSFIEEIYTLSPAYGEFPLPLISDSVQIYEMPFIDDNDKFGLDGELCQDLEDDAKMDLLTHLLSLHQADPERFAKVDWDKLADCDTSDVLGFTPSVAILAEEDYILEEELVPEDIIIWANDDFKRGLLFAMGVLPESSPIVQSRKFISEHIPTPPDLSTTVDDVIRCINTLRWIEKCDFVLNRPQEYDLLLNIVKIAERKVEWRWLMDEISEKAVQWDDRNYLELRNEKRLSCCIYLHKESMPRGVFLEGKNYLFYRYPSDSKSFKEGNEVYIQASLEEDIENELFKLLSREEYGLIYGSRYNELSEKCKTLEQQTERIEQENKKLEQENEVLRKELEDFKARYGQEPLSIPTVTARTNNGAITIRAGIDNGLSKDDRIKAQLEAQQALMDTYGQWVFPENYGAGEYRSVVRDIKDEQGNDMVIVLKSYRDTSQPLKITAEECEALLKEGATLYLCIYEGSRLVIREKDFISLIGGQESITISFDASNLTREQDINRIQKFVELLRYFSGLHIAIEQYNLSAINLYTRKEGEQIETTDDDL